MFDNKKRKKKNTTTMTAYSADFYSMAWNNPKFHTYATTSLYTKLQNLPGHKFI